MYVVKSNRVTNHLAGIAERTKSSMGSLNYSVSACSVLSRNAYLANTGTYADLAEAIDALDSHPDRKPCKKCLAAAKAQLAAEQEAKAKADAPRNAYFALVERVNGNGMARPNDPEFHALSAGEENAEYSVSEGVYEKDSWEYYASILSAYEEMLPVYTAEFAEPVADEVEPEPEVSDAEWFAACKRTVGYLPMNTPKRAPVNEEVKNMVKLTATEIGAVRDWPKGHVTIDFTEALRGASAVKFTEQDARWLRASLNDIARRQGWDRDDD